MKISPDEISDILSQTTTFLGQLLATSAELKENLLDQQATDSQQKKVDQIKQELEQEKNKMKELRGRQQHKRELEQARKDSSKRRQHEGRGANGFVALRNARGQLLGWLQAAGMDRVNVLDARGRLVAREINGMTLQPSGRLVGRGKLGLVVLGAETAARKNPL